MARARHRQAVTDRTARLTHRRCNALPDQPQTSAYTASLRLYREAPSFSPNYPTRSWWRRGDAGSDDSRLRLLVLTQHLVRGRVRVRISVSVSVSRRVRIRSTSTAEALSDCTHASCASNCSARRALVAPSPAWLELCLGLGLGFGFGFGFGLGLA